MFVPVPTAAIVLRTSRPAITSIAALTDIEPGAWHDRTFLEALVPAAIRVTVGEGERKIQNIQIK